MLRNDAALRYEAGSALDPKLDGTAGVYFNKQHGDAFSNSEFGSHLEALNLGNLVIAGVFAGGSVAATALDAIKRGYKVTIISDAIAGSDDEARDKALAELKGAGAQIETSAQFIASLGSASPSSLERAVFFRQVHRASRRAEDSSLHPLLYPPPYQEMGEEPDKENSDLNVSISRAGAPSGRTLR
jgi:hypothetical protein